ncbi:MFS transporter [Candidatus Peregrinibacteria bacterium CG_4_10_14_0_2_um_filter_38_24]|nr:MAG: MFS transporter [Candidatus Peregrinibacteria bacterium CG_4_10_14_0_2_um_filter_38_24]PJC39370.1 MAG: MFS transporter [Candidatus Peregrinibacteria bacterium CG_4_9_14_0_2_um_filter_38_9]
MKNWFKGITKNVILLGFVSLFTDLTSQMIFPLIPLYLTSVLGASAVVVGAVEGAAETTASLLKVVSGYWSDKIQKRKPFIFLGYGLSSITKPLFALATFWPLVLGIRVIERIGKGIRGAPRDAIVTDSCEQKYYGKAFGFQRAMDGAGSVMGAILAWLLLPILGYKNLFLASFWPGLIVIFFIYLVKEKKPEKIPEAEKQTLRLSVNLLPKNLKLFVFISAIFALGHFGYAFLILKAKYIGFSDSNSILLYVFFYIIYTIVTTPAGALSDRIGRKIVLSVGFLLFALTSFGLIFANTLPSLLLAFAVYGVFFAMVDGVQRAFVADVAPKHLKATALGLLQTAIALTALPGGLMAGLLWDKFGPNATFIYGGTLAIISFVMLLFVKTENVEPEALAVTES